MKISQKLRLGALIVLVLIALNAAATIVLSQQITNKLRHLVEVEEPLEQAILELEINVGETARAVLEFMLDRDRFHINAIQDSQRDFELFAHRFERLAETDEERALIREVTEIYGELKRLGDDIVSMATQQFDDLQEFRNAVEAIDILVDENLHPAIYRSSTDVSAKLETALNMETHIERIFSEIESYLLQPDPLLKQKIFDSELDLDRFDARFRTTTLSADEKRWLELIGEAFGETMNAGTEIVVLTDSMHENLTKFQHDVRTIDRILDDDIQILILRKTERASEDAQKLAELAPLLMFVLGSLTFVVVAAVGIIVSRNLTSGVNWLGNAVAEYGKGNLEYRMVSRTNDELDTLAGAFNEMADRRKADEEMVRRGENRLRAVVDTAPDGIVTIDENGIIRTFNAGAERIFGYRAIEVVGKNVSMLMQGNIARSHDGYIERYLESGSTSPVIGATRDLTGLRKDGSVFPLELAVGEMATEDERMFTGIIRDITDRRQAEDAIKRSENRLQAIVDTAADGIITIDENCIVLTFNPGAERIFGYGAAEVIGENVTMLMQGENASAHDGYIKRYLESGSASPVIGATRDLVGLRKDGSAFPLELAVGEMAVDGERHFAGIIRDISERKAAEEELHAAREEAVLANRTKSDFLANMSHELRTPLNAIIGFSDMIRGETFGPVGSPKYLEYVRDINESGTHLLALINDILDLSKVEAGKTELHEENVDVSWVMQSCITLLKERAEAGGVKIECDTASDLPALRVDQRKLKQILINLLSNAVKFTPSGGTVVMRAWSRSNDGYVFQIADTGIGIELGDIAKALAPFSQIDSNLSRKYDGTGLGLPLAKALVETHGGSLDLQSEAGLGTTVTVRFPAERIVSEAATGT